MRKEGPNYLKCSFFYRWAPEYMNDSFQNLPIISIETTCIESEFTRLPGLGEIAT